MAQESRSASLTKAEEAFHAIRTQIATGQLPGGARLTLQSLSDELHMSLTPIREALRLLQASGLVEYRPHHGHVVTGYSIRRAEEIYLLRETLEPLATRLAAERLSNEELDEVRELHESFGAAIHDGEDATIVGLNEQWHRRIYDGAHSPYLDDFIDRLWTGVPYQAIWFIHRRHKSFQDHDAVMRALVERRPAAAASAMRKHIEKGKRATIEHLRLINAPEL